MEFCNYTTIIEASKEIFFSNEIIEKYFEGTNRNL